jgi:hypothetical protein
MKSGIKSIKENKGGMREKEKKQNEKKKRQRKFKC